MITLARNTNSANIFAVLLSYFDDTHWHFFLSISYGGHWALFVSPSGYLEHYQFENGLEDYIGYHKLFQQNLLD